MRAVLLLMMSFYKQVDSLILVLAVENKKKLLRIKITSFWWACLPDFCIVTHTWWFNADILHVVEIWKTENWFYTLSERYEVSGKRLELQGFILKICPSLERLRHSNLPIALYAGATNYRTTNALTDWILVLLLLPQLWDLTHANLCHCGNERNLSWNTSNKWSAAPSKSKMTSRILTMKWIFFACSFFRYNFLLDLIFVISFLLKFFIYQMRLFLSQLGVCPVQCIALDRV